MDRVIPYLINLGDVIPARSKAAMLNELAMALIECVNLYGKKLKKLGKISKISMCFWPVRLIPLNDTRACVGSYLLNKQEKLNVGNFAKTLPKPDNAIKGSDPETFLSALQSYNKTYLKAKNFRRSALLQEALFSAGEIGYLKSFFLNQYNISAFNEPYFKLEGDPITKSVNQVKIIQEVYDFVALKDVNLLESYGQIIIKLCDRWLQKSSQEVDKIKGTTVDTREEEKQLALLNKELQQEKERDLHNTPEELLKTGKYKINDKSSEFFNHLNAMKSIIDKIRNGANQNDINNVEVNFKDLELKHKDLGNAISRYSIELSQLRKNLEREAYDIEKSHSLKISELEKNVANVQKQMAEKHRDLSSDLSSAEDINVQIKTEKQIALDAIESIKDTELTNIQDFLNTYTIEIKTQTTVVGIPIFIFFFTDPNTHKTTERAPVLPIMIDKSKVVSNKAINAFRDKIRDLMNKLTPIIDFVETEGDKANLMESIKNIDTALDDAINDLRIRKILGKKQSLMAKDIINNLVW